MLLEVPLSMVAWFGVVVIQAIVHFGILQQRRTPTEATRLQDGFIEEDFDAPSSNTEEPEDLDMLLSQTGDEVISTIRSNSSFERRAQQQLEKAKEE